MGLPLYIAPVESDIASKSWPKSAPGQGRSPIRRARNSRPTDTSRENRRRALAAAAAYQQSNTSSIRRNGESRAYGNPDDETVSVRWSYRPQLSGSDESNATAAATFELDATSRRTHEQLREIIASRANSALDDRVASFFGQRWAELHARSIPSPPAPESAAPEPVPAPTQSPPAEPASGSSGRSVAWSSQEPSAPARSSTADSRRHWSQRARSAASEMERRELERRHPFLADARRSRISRSPHPSGLTDNDLERARRSYMARRTAGSASPGASSEQLERLAYERFGERFSRRRRRLQERASSVERLQEARFDGLGDRDRSLSPEGDGVWDTLLTTLTPDPQPPSVGSSFASASASVSAAASNSAPTGSSSTPITEPDAVEEAFEPPCESACEGSDTENDDEEEEAARNALSRMHNRSYASVVAAPEGDSTNDEVLELLGGIGGMQRIVRNFARREDIPDEWWAEAGLSRTLGREESS